MPGRLFDILFVNAGTTTQGEYVKVGDVITDEFMRVILTNALLRWESHVPCREYHEK